MSLQPLSGFLPEVTDGEWHEVDDLPAGVCPTCWEIHRCDVCHDAGFLWTPSTRQELVSRGTNRWPCGACKGASVDGAEPLNVDAAMRIPVAYRDADMNKLDSGQRQAIADIVSEHPQKSLLTMTGNVGAGKTYAAVVALRARWLATAQRGAFWPVIDLLERYRATFDADRATETSAAIDAELRRSPLLVLDDWGKQKSTEWAEQQLFRLLDERVRDRRPLIVTTNATKDDFSEALRSRLLGSSARVAQFTGRDRRLG